MSDSQPAISILLPNLNNVSFLKERFDSILAQTYNNWELVVVDNYSDDGAWELIQAYARQDRRIHATQARREGMYANWNNCLRLARADYIYIATSDDSMTPDLCEIMIAALETHRECEIAHCALKLVDQSGLPTKRIWEETPSVCVYGQLMQKHHIRYAPRDALVCMSLGTPYLSMTQLLIRRTLFDRIGNFRNDWGSFGDFEWQLRATLVANTIHIPQRLATWRQHEAQASQDAAAARAVAAGWFLEMIDAGLDRIKDLNPQLWLQLQSSRLFLFPQLAHSNAQIAWSQNRYRNLQNFTIWAITHPLSAASWLQEWAGRKLGAPTDVEDVLRSEIERLHIRPCHIIDADCRADISTHLEPED